MIIFPLIWLLGLMLGINCIRMGMDGLLHQRVPVLSSRCAITGCCARCAGLSLLLLGLMLIYAINAPLLSLPGARMFQTLYLIR